MSLRYANSAKAQPLNSSLRMAGQQVLQDVYLQYIHQGYDEMMKQKQNIDPYRQNKNPEDYQVNLESVEDTQKSLLQIQKSLLHQELERKGYIINKKDKPIEAVEVPMYEIFDLQNPNYKKVFHPKNLESKVGYFYNDPDFQHIEELYVDEEDVELAKQQTEYLVQQEKRKQGLLNRINANINAQKVQRRQQEMIQQKDEAIVRAIMKPLKNKQQKKNPIEKKHVQFSDHKEFDDDLKKLTPPAPRVKVKMVTSQGRASSKVDDSKNKTKWRQKSNELRDALKATRQK